MAGRPRLLTRPPQLDRAVARPRLVELAGSSPVVIVSGPPGSGTTIAAAQIAGLPERDVAWCRLASGYDRATDVVDMVAAATGTSVTASTEPRLVELADHLLDLLEARPVPVVIDDHHLAADGDLDRLLAECAGLLPAGARFVVATAARPAGLIGLLPALDVSILGPRELALTDAEAGALFDLHGAPPERAVVWNRALHGWCQGVAAGAATPDAEPAAHVTALFERVAHDDPVAATVLDLAAALPYVTPGLLQALGIEDPDAALAETVRRVPLLDDDGAFVRLGDAAAAAHLERLDPARVAELRLAAGHDLADDDPTTAIEALLGAGAFDAAADVLGDHLSEIGVERALTWLYRLPAELRRRFPPVLAAGQATVEVDTALAEAHTRVEAATTERARREALFALGSVEHLRGELAAAAGAYEAALRSGRDDARFTARVNAELASTRWLLGDVAGARAALDAAEPSPATRWLTAQLDVVDPSRARRHDEAGTSAFDVAAGALRALVDGDDEQAGRLAAVAYRAASEHGGEALCAAGAVYAWALLRDGRTDDALVVAEELERRLGPRHRLGRLHGAIVRERVSRHGDGHHERDLRRLRDLRAQGYASVARLADLVLDRDASSSHEPAVVVAVLGTHHAMVDGRRVERGDWKSKKAFEVLTVLAAHRSRGCRREAVIETVWPGREPDKGRTLLRTALSEIRRTIEPDRPPGEASRHLAAGDDLVRLDGWLDVDRAEELLADDPVAAFEQLRVGLAAELESLEWARELTPRVERLLLTAAARIPESAPTPVRVAALEASIAAEPWQRSHYDALAAIHRAAGDEAAAADVERRWFADD